LRRAHPEVANFKRRRVGFSHGLGVGRKRQRATAIGEDTYGHRSKSRRSIELQLEEGARDEPKLRRKGVYYVLRIQQLVVEIARQGISAKGT